MRIYHESEVVGDFKTDYLNVFEIEDEFVYLFQLREGKLY